MRITTSDKYYITLPLFHAQGLAMMTYGTMIAGASAVLKKLFVPQHGLKILRNMK